MRVGPFRIPGPRVAGRRHLGRIVLAAIALAVAGCGPIAGQAGPPESPGTGASPSAATAPSTTPVLPTTSHATPATPAQSLPSPASATPSAASPAAASAAPVLRLPPQDAEFDYQLGGAYPPPDGASIVVRDRGDPPAPDTYAICYVNGFQAQPDEADWWAANHPDLLLHDRSGELVVDPDWDEILLDPTTRAKREAITRIVGAWIEDCAADGFDAVEIDNLDTFTRSGGLVAEDDAVDLVRRYAEVAHRHNLAIAQKNAAEIAGRRAEMGTDFAIAEECHRWSECEAYTAAYGDRVLIVEYRRRDFRAGCAADPGLSIVLRDLDLVAPSDPGYVYEAC